MEGATSNLQYNAGVGALKAIPLQSAEDSPYARDYVEVQKSYCFGLSDVLIIAFLIVCILSIIYYSSNSSQEIVTEYIHKPCSKMGPCDKQSCPMHDLSNPFRVAFDQKKLAYRYNNIIDTAAVNVFEKSENIDDDLKNTLESVIDGSKKSLKTLSNMGKDLIATIEELSEQLYELQNANEREKAIIIQNKIVTATNALYILSLLSIIQEKKIEVNGIYNVIKDSINDVSSLSNEEDRTFFEKSYKSFNNSVTKISTDVGDISDLSKNPKIVEDVVKMVQDYDVNGQSQAGIEVVLKHMTKFSNYESSVRPSFINVMKIHDYLMGLLSATRSDTFKERLDPREPGNVPSELANQQIENGDYNSTIIQASLEPSIAQNHKVFAQERNRIDSGAGIYGIRDDPNDVVSWVGLFRPTYKKSDGTSAEQSSQPLKSIPSDNPNKQMMDRVRLLF